jgi:hypothetical protein
MQGFVLPAVLPSEGQSALNAAAGAPPHFKTFAASRISSQLSISNTAHW